MSTKVGPFNTTMRRCLTDILAEDAVSRVMHASGLDMKSLDTTEEVYALRAELESESLPARYHHDQLT